MTHICVFSAANSPIGALVPRDTDSRESGPFCARGGHCAQRCRQQHRLAPMLLRGALYSVLLTCDGYTFRLSGDMLECGSPADSSPATRPPGTNFLGGQHVFWASRPAPLNAFLQLNAAIYRPLSKRLANDNSIRSAAPRCLCLDKLIHFISDSDYFFRHGSSFSVAKLDLSLS